MVGKTLSLLSPCSLSLSLSLSLALVEEALARSLVERFWLGPPLPRFG